MPTSSEAQASSGRPQPTAARSSPLSASLVGIFCCLFVCGQYETESNIISLNPIYFPYTESGRTIACAHHNATLQCGSGQVIEVDDSFYGRKTAHYCRLSPNPSPTSTQEECSWMDVVDSVTGT